MKMVLLNNNFLGNVRQWQQLFYNGRFSQTPMVNPDFVAICAAYGIAAENVNDRSQLSGAIERMVNSAGAYLLNVNIDPADMIFPMIPLGAAVDEMMINANEMFKL